MTIKLYGQQAKEITQGQQFIATVFDVEGRTVVELVPVENVFS